MDGSLGYIPHYSLGARALPMSTPGKRWMVHGREIKRERESGGGVRERMKAQQQGG